MFPPDELCSDKHSVISKAHRRSGLALSDILQIRLHDMKFFSVNSNSCIQSLHFPEVQRGQKKARTIVESKLLQLCVLPTTRTAGVAVIHSSGNRLGLLIGKKNYLQVPALGIFPGTAAKVELPSEECIMPRRRLSVKPKIKFVLICCAFRAPC